MMRAIGNHGSAGHVQSSVRCIRSSKRKNSACRRFVFVVGAGVMATACGQAAFTTAGDSAETAAGIALPDGAHYAFTAEEYCETNTDNHRIEMAFSGTVRAISNEQPMAVDEQIEADAGPDEVQWATFDVEAWFTEDLGTEIALWAPRFEGAPGERWLIAASRYSIGGLASGDVFWCASELESADGLAEWAADYGGSVEPGENRPENPAPPEILAEIDEAEATWAASAPTDYTAIVFHEGDVTPGDGCSTQAVRIVVEDGQPVQARNPWDDCAIDLATAPSITDLFDDARAGAGATDYAVEFDPEFGFITSLSAYDRSVGISGGVSGFVAETRPYVSAADGEAFRSAFEDARSKWVERGMTTYMITIENICFCGFGGPARITVVDGEVTTIDGGGDEIRTGPGYTLTVGDTFALIEEAARTADRLQVAYHPELGHPVDVNIDYIINAVDDELQILVHDLEPGG